MAASVCGVFAYLVTFLVLTYAIKTWLLVTQPDAPSFAVLATDGELWQWDDADFWTAAALAGLVFAVAWCIKMMCTGGERLVRRTCTNACLCVCPCFADYIEHPNDRLAREMREERRRRQQDPSGAQAPGRAAGISGVDWSALAEAATAAARSAVATSVGSPQAKPPPKANPGRREWDYAYSRV